MQIWFPIDLCVICFSHFLLEKNNEVFVFQCGRLKENATLIRCISIFISPHVVNMELSILIEPVEVNKVIFRRAKKSLALVKENDALKRKIADLEVREKRKREITKRYRVKNRDKIAASRREYRQRNKET